MDLSHHTTPGHHASSDNNKSVKEKNAYKCDFLSSKLSTKSSQLGLTLLYSNSRAAAPSGQSSALRGSGCLFLVIVKLPRVPSLLTTITAAWTSSLQINVSVTFSSIVDHRSNLSQFTAHSAFNIASKNGITVLCNA